MVAYSKKQSREYYQKNKEKMYEQNRLYRSTKKGRINHLLNAARARAKKFGLDFELDREWLEKKFENGSCEMTGIFFTFEAPRKGYRANPYASSLERHDSKKGYTKSNTKLVIWAYNQAKGQWNQKHFCQIIKAIYRGMFNE